MTSSLVEDMARACPLCGYQIGIIGGVKERVAHPYVQCELSGQQFSFRVWRLLTYASVLKDRLPADDRELVERARNEAQTIRNGLPQTADANLIDALADRIIVLSGLES